MANPNAENPAVLNRDREEDDEEHEEDIDEENDPEPQRPRTHPASSSQLATIPQFAGTAEPQEVDVWIDQVEAAAIRGRWDSRVTAASAKARMTGAAAIWIRSQKTRGSLMSDWPSLRLGLHTAFGDGMSTVAAARAIANLNQKATETVQEFFDRVVLALDKKNFAVDARVKQTPAYQINLERDIFYFFAAGIREEYRETALAGMNPPTNPNNLLWVVKNLEKERNRSGMQQTQNVATLDHQVAGTASGAVAGAAALGPGAGGTAVGPYDGVLAQITAELAELKKFRKSGGARPKDMSKVECFYCHNKGHVQMDCRKKQNELGKKYVKKKFNQKFGKKKSGKSGNKAWDVNVLQMLEALGLDSETSENESEEE